MTSCSMPRPQRSTLESSNSQRLHCRRLHIIEFAFENPANSEVVVAAVLGIEGGVAEWKEALGHAELREIEEAVTRGIDRDPIVLAQAAGDGCEKARRHMQCRERTLDVANAQSLVVDEADAGGYAKPLGTIGIAQRHVPDPILARSRREQEAVERRRVVADIEPSHGIDRVGEVAPSDSEPRIGACAGVNDVETAEAQSCCCSAARRRSSSRRD